MRSGGKKGSALSAGAASRTRRRLAVAGAAALLAVPGLMLAMRGTAVESAVRAAIADPASILAARSPGARAAGALTQTKRRYAKSGVNHAPRPTERVLGQARTRPTGALPFGDAGNPLVGSLLNIPPDTFAGVGDEPLSGAPGIIAFGGTPATGIGLIGGGGSGGGGIGGGGTTPTQPGLPPVSAIPEPSTWLMTIMGFFAIATGLRHRRPTRPTKAGRHTVA